MIYNPQSLKQISKGKYEYLKTFQNQPKVWLILNNETNQNSLLREYSVELQEMLEKLAKIQDNSLATITEIFPAEKAIYTIEEYRKGSSIYTFLQNDKEISLAEFKEILEDFLNLITKFKDEGIIHGAINEYNLILDETVKKQVFLTNFVGVSQNDKTDLQNLGQTLRKLYYQVPQRDEAVERKLRDMINDVFPQEQMVVVEQEAEPEAEEVTAVAPVAVEPPVTVEPEPEVEKAEIQNSEVVQAELVEEKGFSITKFIIYLLLFIFHLVFINKVFLLPTITGARTYIIAIFLIAIVFHFYIVIVFRFTKFIRRMRITNLFNLIGKVLFTIFWWCVLTFIFLVIAKIALSFLMPYEDASVTYTQEAGEEGSTTGYEVTLEAGTYTVGTDIEPGRYNVSVIGWDDSIILSDPDYTYKEAESGTIYNMELLEGQTIEIVDYENSDLFKLINQEYEEEITFTQLHTADSDGEKVTEQLVITDDGEEICYRNEKLTSCNSLQKYEDLKADIGK